MITAKLPRKKHVVLSELVEQIQKDMKGHVFNTLTFEEQGGSLILENGKDYLPQLTDEELESFTCNPERMVVDDINLIIWNGGLPLRFEHLLQIVRAAFPGVGFDILTVYISLEPFQVLSITAPQGARNKPKRLDDELQKYLQRMAKISH